MALHFKAPENIVLKPIITVFGVGGAGGNAVNNMLNAKLQGAKFVVANTDAQSLEHSLCDNKIQLGITITKGLGAGASPEIGALAAEESADEIRGHLEGSNMVFITAGMGGGTGTGASPVVAKIAKELGILTVGVVTKPFHFEGRHRLRTATQGLLDLQRVVDTLIVIPNQNLFRIANEHTTFADAFKMADDVLHAGVRGVTDLMIMPGLINLDFADIRTVMSEMGKAMMGTGEASGEERAVKAAEAAISNPLLDHNSMRGAKGVLINITGGVDMTLFEVDSAANRIREEVGDVDANIIFGSTFNPELNGIIRVSVVATGIDADQTLNANKSYINEIVPEISTIAPQEATNNYEARDTEIVEEIPNFAQYISDKGETNDSDTPPLNLRVQVMPDNNTLPPAPPNINKNSLLSRMWNSLKTNPSQNSEPARPSVTSPSPAIEGESDIHDIPTFLRKPK
ncbi:cell division protein FtsZ [Candidatus Tisiphia endosymbiont of Nemotelus uliginosus]|uniref:cell division protein FtsZ n=1 Tax=Candidatus Tisiphia endosymbiont of Nemotelus uliginosus TaxID=3077926 RepID=UPI0035C89138